MKVAVRTCYCPPIEARFAKVMPAVHHDYANVNGVRLHYAQAGSGPLILFLHGFPQFWYCWKSQLEEFGGDYRAVAPDLRGYNLSERPAEVKQYKARSRPPCRKTIRAPAKMTLDGWGRGEPDPAVRAAYIAAWSQPGALTGGLNYYRASPLYPPLGDDPGATGAATRSCPVHGARAHAGGVGDARSGTVAQSSGWTRRVRSRFAHRAAAPMPRTG